MQGIILLNAYTKSAGAMRQATRIAEELRLRGVSADIRKNGAFDAEIVESRPPKRRKPNSLR